MTRAKKLTAFETAQHDFRAIGDNKTAGKYLSAAGLAACEDEIGDDEWLNAIAEVIAYLEK